jgi:superfamily I DNA/RNA helicase
VVGDDAQAIYSFRAATVRNILDFLAEFSPQAEIITLDRNYRSTQPILAAAKGVIGSHVRAIFIHRREESRINPAASSPRSNGIRANSIRVSAL